MYGVNYLFPFFLLGYGIRRYASYFFSQRWALLLASVFIVSFLFKPIFYTFMHTGLSFFGGRLLDVIVAFSGIPILFHFRRPIPWLAFFGYYAFGIHLFHRVSIMAVRLPFQALHIQDPMLIFASYLIGGIIIALFMQVIFEKSAITRVLVLGLKKTQKPVPVRIPSIPFTSKKLPAHPSAALETVQQIS